MYKSRADGYSVPKSGGSVAHLIDRLARAELLVERLQQQLKEKDKELRSKEEQFKEEKAEFEKTINRLMLQLKSLKNPKKTCSESGPAEQKRGRRDCKQENTVERLPELMLLPRKLLCFEEPSVQKNELPTKNNIRSEKEDILKRRNRQQILLQETRFPNNIQAHQDLLVKKEKQSLALAQKFASKTLKDEKLPTISGRGLQKSQGHQRLISALKDPSRKEERRSRAVHFEEPQI